MSNRTTPNGSQIVQLARNTLHRIEDGEGTLIACLGPKVWITLEADPRDVVLTAGQSFRIDRPGLTLITAFEGSTIAVLPPQPAVLRAA